MAVQSVVVFILAQRYSQQQVTTCQYPSARKLADPEKEQVTSIGQIKPSCTDPRATRRRQQGDTRGKISFLPATPQTVLTPIKTVIIISPAPDFPFFPLICE
ncbi:synaptotagmin-3 [Lates japonicus]|uniref:Synaptotagmin-3 n=1 Tax=Lates japonicus TaxID=270547 RepID=A0AAD3MNF1_LATJO|nr:synaptotagmin-3 [Lates japonicus]